MCVIRTAVAKPSLSAVQAVVAIAAGLITVLGGAYTLSLNFGTALNLRAEPGTGRIVAILQEWPIDKPVGSATLEVLTPKDELVATLISAAGGQIRYSLKEGSYRLRVSHPRFDAEKRSIHVVSGQTTELTIAMRPSSSGSTPLGSTVKTVDAGVDRVKRFFKDLGL